jgi:hypothetical protein
MPTFRCEFTVTADLVIPPGVPEQVLNGAGGLVVTLKNAATNDEGQAVSLHATVVGSAPAIETAHEALRAALSAELDLLAFATHSRFKIGGPLRLFDWEPSQRLRRFRLFHTRDARDPPNPGLETQYLETVARLNGANPLPVVRTALRYFRRGLLDDQPEDQFMWLWLALEVIAEDRKERVRVPITCSACGANVKCAHCGDEATRVPMAKQAIDQLIATIMDEEHATEVSRRQFIARNALMHGRSREWIEAECCVPIGEIVDELGVLAWNAIMTSITVDESETPLALAHRDWEFTNLTLIAAAFGEFEHTGPGAHPTENVLPQGALTMHVRFPERRD